MDPSLWEPAAYARSLNTLKIFLFLNLTKKNLNFITKVILKIAFRL